MGLMPKKETLAGKYDGFVPAALLGVGAISSGGNVRKTSLAGGWQGRKGVTLLNTTALAAAPKSIHRYENPLGGDVATFVQANGKLLLGTNNPPTVTDAAWGSVEALTCSSTQAGFSTVVDEYLAYADGSGGPAIYGGTSPRVRGFVVYENTNVAYIDATREVGDSSSTTTVRVFKGASDKYYVLARQRLTGITVTLGSATNNTARTLTVKAWRSGAWAAVSDLADGTSTASKTHKQSGDITWTGSASDGMVIIGGIMGYGYEFSISGAPDEIQVTTVKCKFTAGYGFAALTNKWDGVWEFPSGVRFFKNSTGQYQEALGLLSNESTSQYLDLSSSTSSDYLYVKAQEPICAVGLAVVNGYGNTASQKIDNVEYWNGSDWTVTTGLSDTTLDSTAAKGFAQTGAVYWDFNAILGLERKRTFQGDQAAGYWYRVSWDGTLSANTRVYMCVYAAAPQTLQTYDGCLENKGRLFLWGDREYPNRLRYSNVAQFDSFVGNDSGYTESFGDLSAIKAVVPFYNELMVFKGKGVWLLEGYNASTFGILKLAHGVGIASPKTVQVVEVGYPSMNSDEPVTIVIWQDVDGVYVCDGRKPRKVSMPVNQYFDPASSSCIAAASIKALSAFVDPVKNEYHLLLPAVELVYNYLTDEWYPPWTRNLPLVCGTHLTGTDGRTYAVGASSGFVQLLEQGTADKSAANASVAIAQSLRTRVIGVEDQISGMLLRFMLRGVWVEGAAQASGTGTLVAYKDQATSGTTLGTVALTNSGYSLMGAHVDCNVVNCSTLELEFSVSSSAVVLDVRGFVTTIEVQGIKP